MFCNCDCCNKIRELGESQFHTRSQVLLDDKICIDFPPEAYVHSIKYGVNLSALKYLLITHSHMDHFYAHDFILRGYKYAVINEPVLEIYGNSDVEKIYYDCTEREMKPVVSQNLKFTKIKSYDELNLDGYRVIAFPANHGKTEEALLFYIEKDGVGYLHMYDTGRLSDETVKFLAAKGARANLVSFDCTYVDGCGGESSRHMGIADNMYMKQKFLDYGIISNDAKIVITHFSHNGSPFVSRLEKLEEEYGVIAAKDGLEVVF